MRSLFALFLLLFIFRSQAQPVIDRSNYFEIGDSALLFFKFDTSLLSVDVGAAGEEVIWDLSSVDIGHPSVIVDTLLFIDPVGTPFYPTNLSADYSAANICMLRRTEEFSPENNDHNYYVVNEDSLAFLGHWAATGGAETWEDHHPDPLRELIFPLTYGDSYIDGFTRYFFDQSGSGAHFSAGTYSVVVDGWGTLITPEGEGLNDVIRVYTVRTYTDSSAMGIEQVTQRNYRWFQADRKGAIVSMQMAIGDSTLVETLHYLKQVDVATAIAPIAHGSISIINSDPLIFALGDDRTMRSATIYNAAGQQVWSEAITANTLVIDRDRFPPGIYTILVRTREDRAITSRFAIAP